MDCAEKMSPSHDYLNALEEERRKMEVFHRELPLSLQLVSQAIDSCRRQMATESLFMGRCECEETTGEAYPVLEEFIPLKPSSSSDEDKSKTHDSSGKKPDWLRSVQLWNQEPPPATKEIVTLSTLDSSWRKSSAGGVEMQKEGEAFRPFDGDKKTTGRPGAAASSSAETNSCREEKEGRSHRKARRCWSPELHRRFLQALKQLGGSHVATPKQIRELMMVDGLTNDEVKSHLQKYRLHTRRPSPPIQSSTQHPQFLVVGGIWVPPPDYTTVEQTPAEPTADGVYTPVPAYPQASPVQLHQEKKQSQISPASPLQWEGRDSHEEGHANSSSCTISSSSHNTTTSSAF